jgi:ribosomal protein RSM22 (predicted rRNA methylase)
VEIPPDLRASLETTLSGVSTRDAADTVERLIEAYRSGRPPARPILSSVDDVMAYAGYRMPATYSAVFSALAQLRAALPSLRPRSQLDLGGGTGAAAWAAAEQFTQLDRVTVVDQVEAALTVGRRLAVPSRLHTIADWRLTDLAEADLEPADLVTVSYVLGELAEPARESLVRRAAAAAGMGVLMVEPGTPAGYQRILDARRVLIAAGLTVAAPCPHEAACPMVPGQDWCHFSVRVNRSSVHRRLKSAELGFEDEKFSYVAAVRDRGPHRPGRVLRRPTLGKGLVSLYLCTPDEGLDRQVVSKRQGALYRAARDVGWGDAWPPEAAPASESGPAAG